jgi:hypothetical protein
MTSVLAGKKFTPPFKGTAEVDFTKPVSKNDKGMVTTTIMVKNNAPGPILRLTVDETWYDAGGGLVTGGKGIINRLEPGEVGTIKIETPYNASAITFGDTQGVSSYKDISPRVGVSYDVLPLNDRLNDARSFGCWRMKPDPWIATCAGYFGADAAWDPTTQNRLWMTSGTGHFYCDVPTTAGALSLTYVSQVCGNESIIPCKIVKAPSPNGRILIACEDRPFFSLVDAIQPTTNYFPNSGIGGGVSQGYDIVYSDSDPTVCWGTDGGSIWRSTDKGLTYTSLGIGGWTTLASTTPLSCVSIGYSSQQCHYTTDGGTTWNVCQYFNGSTNVPFLGTGGTSYNTSFVVTTDKAGTYYCYDPYGANTGSAALFKSTNGGATWTLVSSQASAIMGGGGGCLISVPGTTPLHLIAANGYSGAGYYNFSAPLSFSKNAGVTWQTASETYFASSVTIGKKNPTSTYPYTVYMAGNLVSLGEYGIYRCDDFGATTRTWTLMPGLKNVTCDSLRGGLSGDLEVYGTLFAGTSGAGAAWVRLT